MNQKRYLLFVRPQGSKCWTQAMRGIVRSGPAVYAYTKKGLKHAQADAAKSAPWQTHIATVELPE